MSRFLANFRFENHTNGNITVASAQHRATDHNTKTKTGAGWSLAVALLLLAMTTVSATGCASTGHMKDAKDAKDDWYPPGGHWDGTAPVCRGKCDEKDFAWCVGQTPGCAYSDAKSPPDFGNTCTGGRKAYCVKKGLYPPVEDYTTLNKVGEWRGTAPVCSGSCEKGEFGLCRSDHGESCTYSDGIDASQLKGFGKHCGSGRKIFCVPISYIEPSDGVVREQTPSSEQ